MGECKKCIVVFFFVCSGSLCQIPSKCLIVEPQWVILEAFLYLGIGPFRRKLFMPGTSILQDTVDLNLNTATKQPPFISVVPTQHILVLNKCYVEL